MNRLTLAAAGLLFLAQLMPEAGTTRVAETTYPSRALRIIVPISTGGGGDLSARLIAQRLFQNSGHAIVVENRAGAGTIVGTGIVAKAPADGYTILMAPGAFAANPSTYKKMPFDTVDDFAPITQMLFIPQLIVVHPALPAHSGKEFIALSKARPGQLQYAASGHGTLPHLTMELFASMARIRMINVP